MRNAAYGANAWKKVGNVPSTPGPMRTSETIWRKLRRLRVVQLVDGLVALPASAQNREQLDWIADEVLDAGGESWTWTATPGTNAQQRTLAAKLAETAAEEHAALLDEAEAVLAASDRPHRRTLKRLHDDLLNLDADDSARRRRVLKQLGDALAPAKATSR